MSNTPPRLNELAYVKLLHLLLFSMGFLILCAVLISPMWHNLSDTVHTLFIILFSLSFVTSLAGIVRLLFCRVRIDENGADADDLFGNNAMAWDEIRTAAIVRLNINGQKADPFIVLSNREAEVVLTYRALTTRKVLAPDETVRIPLNPRRRAAVEYYLHMSLPEYTL